MKKVFGLVCLLFSSLVLAQAQNVVINPQSIIVNPVPSFNVSVSVDKDPSGAGNPVYQIGERIRVSVRPSETAYIYIFNVRSDGRIVQILPNAFDQNNRVPGGETRTYPPSGARYTFDIGAPTGQNRVIALASRTQLDMNALSQFRNEGNFRVSDQGQESFAQTLSIIVNPLPQRDWVTDTALFTVVARTGTQPQPHPGQGHGSLHIRANIAYADVYINNRHVGSIPRGHGRLNVDSLPAGQHNLRVTAPGYNTVQQVFIINTGQITNLNINQVKR